MPEYRRHAFEKEWHDKVVEFIEENDLAFDSPKYFIKFCVNKYMDEFSPNSVDSPLSGPLNKELVSEIAEQVREDISDDSE